MNLLVTIDRNYLLPLVTMLNSYNETHKDISTDVYIAHSSLEEEDFTYLKEKVLGADIRIHNIEIKERYFSNTPVIERIPEESFYRLLAFLYLPESVERCLYLDPDIYINQSLLSLYTKDMGDSYIAAAGHLHGFRETFNKMRLGGREQERYINSGVMLMNLTAIRRDFTLEKVLDVVREKTAIIHYNGKYKPWLDGYKGDLDCFYPKPEKLGEAPKGLVSKQVKSVCRIMKPTKQQAIILFGGALFVILCLFSYLFFGKELLKLVSIPTIFREWLQKFGIFDEVIFILIRAAQTVVKFIPAEPLEIASGYAWGAIPGMLYCVIGNMIGTLAILGLTRYFGQKIIHILLPKKDLKLVKLLENDEKIYALLFFLYLIPGSPKDGFTYFVGLLPVKIAPFMLITGFARMPSVLSSTLCGETMAEQQYWISALIMIVTVVLAVLGGILYRKFVKERGANYNKKECKQNRAN